MEVRNQLVSWFMTYLRDLLPTYIGNLIHLLSTMDFPVGEDRGNPSPQKSNKVKGTPGISEIWFGSHPPTLLNSITFRNSTGKPNMITFHWCSFCITWSLHCFMKGQLLEVETANKTAVSQNNLWNWCKEQFLAAIICLWNFIGHAQKSWKFMCFFHIYKLLYKTWVVPLPRTVTTRTTFFFWRGSQTKPSFATDILGEEGKSNGM